MSKFSLIAAFLFSILSPSLSAAELPPDCSGLALQTIKALVKATGATKCTECRDTTKSDPHFGGISGSCYWKVGKKVVGGGFNSKAMDPADDGEVTQDNFKSYFEAGGYFAEVKSSVSKLGGEKLYDYKAISAYCKMNPEHPGMSYLSFGASANDTKNTPYSHVKSKTKAIYRQLISDGICVPYGDEETVNFSEFDKKYGIGKAVSTADGSDEELGACYNYKKDGKEEGIDCGGDCDACKIRIKLDKEDFVANFNGKDSITISGRVYKRLHFKDEKNPGIANTKVSAQGWSRGAAAKIKKQTITTDKNGRFKFNISLPQYDKRGKMKGKKAGIRITSNNQSEMALINQSQSAPQIINFKKRTDKPMGDNSWGTFTLEVIDAEDDVKKIELYAPVGMLKQKGSSSGAKGGMSPVKLVTDYTKDSYEFGWNAPPMSINFDVSFWQKQRAAFIGKDTALVGGIKTTSEELLRFSGERVGEASQHITEIIQHYQNQGFLLSPEKLKELKNVKSIRYNNALGMFGRVTNGIKFVTDTKKGVKTMAEHTRVIVQEAETGSEGMVRGMLVAVEGLAIIEAGASAFLPEKLKDNFAVKGGKAVKDMTIGVMMKGLKGSLEYAADTFQAGRAKARTRKFPIMAVAVDMAGNRSKPVTLLVDVIHYSSKPE